MGNWVTGPTLLVVKCGTTTAGVRLAHGDYDRGFARALAGAGVALRVLDVAAGAALPPGRADADGVLVTGSPSSVTR